MCIACSRPQTPDPSRQSPHHLAAAPNHRPPAVPTLVCRCRFWWCCCCQLHQTPHQLLMRHRPGPYAPASLGAMPLSPGLHRVLHSRRLPHRTCSLPRVPSCSRSAFASSGRRDAGHLSPTNCRTFVSCTRARIKLGHYTTHGESNQQPPAPRSMPSREPTQSVVTAATAIGSGGTREPSQRYGLQRLGSRGNREALRTLSSPRYRKTTRSSPTPPPPCGGIPWRIESM